MTQYYLLCCIILDACWSNGCLLIPWMMHVDSMDDEVFSRESDSRIANVRLSVCPSVRLSVWNQTIRIADFTASMILISAYHAYWPSYQSTIMLIDHWAYQPSSLSTNRPINHRAYWPSSISTIMPIDHQAYQQLSLSAIRTSFATFKPFGFFTHPPPPTHSARIHWNFSKCFGISRGKKFFSPKMCFDT